MKQEYLELVKALRKELYNHPEVSEQEYKTREIIKDFLRKNTSVEIVDKGRWFYAIKKSENPVGTLAFRGDHDAIISEDGKPFHGCGHDGHTAILAGMALELENEKLDKDIIYLFQHAEENGAGAKECVELFQEQKVDCIFGIHNFSGFPKNQIAFKKGTQFCASKGMSVVLVGKQSHASEPENGINPIYLIAELVNKLEPLSKFIGFGKPLQLGDVEFSSMTLCTIVNVKLGEKAFGVSPSTGELNMTLRAEKDEDMNKLQQMIEGFVSREATKAGIKYKFEFFDVFPDTTNTDYVVDHLCGVLDKGGFEYEILPEPFRGSEDFGYYTKEVPGAYLIVGSGEDHPALHSIQYEFPDDILERGIEAYKAIAKAEMPLK